jgi:predicted DNA-binding protein
MRKLGRKSLPDSMRKKKQVAVRLLDSQIEELEKIADREGISISYFVREAIDSVIQKYSRRKGGK